MANTILCPTRGGVASYPNQDQAIAIAKQRGAEILFLYIVNIQFLGLTAAPKVVDLEAEMEEMGEFMLTMAQIRAEKAGVRARNVVRSGVFREVLHDIIQEFEIPTVVIGSSAGGTGVITPEYIQDLTEDIGGKTGVEFIVVDQGEIVKTYKP